MAHVRRLWIEGPAGRLEGALRVAASPAAAAVIAHPHPLHGGTLHNPVIFHTDRELHRLGWTTLRFNFRGTGESDGEHDHGGGEVDDVGAAVGWLRGVAPDCPLIVVGYSFGSLCGIRHAVRDSRVAALIAIGLPIRHEVPAEVSRLRRPLGIVQGGEDELGPPDEVREALREARPAPDLRIVPGATHLFPGKTREAAAAVTTLGGDLLASL